MKLLLLFLFALSSVPHTGVLSDKIIRDSDNWNK